MKILLLGSKGQLGRELRHSLAPLGELVALDRRQLDLSRQDQLSAQLQQYQADVIVNAAAYNAVDKAEHEQEQAMAINAIAVANLADIARAGNALLIHYSTDYVFDGTQTAPYRETDTPHPLNIYGRSKLAGECAIQTSGCDYLLLRTSWVYSAHGDNFVQRILELARERDQLRIVDDQQGSPTSAQHLAHASAHLIHQAQLRRQQNTFASELYHLCGEGHANRYEFACAIVVEAQTCGLLVQKPGILPIASEDYSQPAKRPRNSVLNTEKIKQQQGVLLPHWRDGLQDVIRTINECNHAG